MSKVESRTHVCVSCDSCNADKNSAYCKKCWAEFKLSVLRFAMDRNLLVERES